MTNLKLVLIKFNHSANAIGCLILMTSIFLMTSVILVTSVDRMIKSDFRLTSFEDMGMLTDDSGLAHSTFHAYGRS